MDQGPPNSAPKLAQLGFPVRRACFSHVRHPNGNQKNSGKGRRGGGEEGRRGGGEEVGLRWTQQIGENLTPRGDFDLAEVHCDAHAGPGPHEAHHFLCKAQEPRQREVSEKKGKHHPLGSCLQLHVRVFIKVEPEMESFSGDFPLLRGWGGVVLLSALPWNPVSFLAIGAIAWE